MSPQVPLIAGVFALLIWLLLLRLLGPRYRVGRLLASTPTITVAEAIHLASGPPRYVAVQGRVDAETDFEDDAHRPLVFRRTRLQLRRGTTWIDLDDHRERVPFEVREGLDSIAIDDSVLDAGLVVVVRESEGTAADVADRVPAATDPQTRVRLRIEQVSSVEHALVAGVPRLATTSGATAPTMTAGLGRPLILATMDRADAMRVLAEGHRIPTILPAVALLGGVLLLLVGIAWAAVAATA